MVKPKSDPRFEKVFKDPRFKKISKKETKVKIDSRFQKMFTDDRFHTKYTVDKRGKKVDGTEKEDLHKFYDIEDDNKQTHEVVSTEQKIPKDRIKKKQKGNATKSSKKKKGAKIEYEDTPEQHKDLEVVVEQDEESSDGKPDFSDIRGETIDGNEGVDLSSDDEIEEEIYIDEQGITHGWGELDEDAKRIENAETFRLAVCNCDWDRITASDLFVLFNSFKPTGGSIRSVKIYMSEFGRERLKEEDISGPKELKEAKLDSDVESGDEGNLEGSGYHMEKLREYQLNRMKYYYAVVECNDIETADKLYEDCDGMEYEMSGTRLDLRFIPNDMTFDDEPIAVANENINLKNYEPTLFLNTALQQSKVRLTWDESDPKRIQNTMRKFTKEDIENMDFKDYLASSSSEDEEERKQRKEKIKSSGKLSVQKSRDADNANTSESGGEETANENGENKGNEDLDNKNSDDENSCDDDEDERIKKYRLLMEEINAKEKKDNNEVDSDEMDGEMEFTWNAGDKEDENNEERRDDADIFDNDENDDDENEAEENDDGFDDPFFQRPHEEGTTEARGKISDNTATKKKSKKKNKKRRLGDEDMTEEEKLKKKELELLLIGEEDDKKHFSLKGILEQEKISKSNKRKRRKRKEDIVEKDDFQFNTNDDRFSALYDSHLYSIDPSEPNYKKTKATEAIIKEAQKRREQRAMKNQEKTQASEKKPSNLSALVSSVKSKTINHQLKKKKNKLKK